MCGCSGETGLSSVCTGTLHSGIWYTPDVDNRTARGCAININRAFRTAVPFWGQVTQIPSNLSPKRDCGPKRVRGKPKTVLIFGNIDSHHKGYPRSVSRVTLVLLLKSYNTTLDSVSCQQCTGSW